MLESKYEELWVMGSEHLIHVSAFIRSPRDSIISVLSTYGTTPKGKKKLLNDLRP